MTGAPPLPQAFIQRITSQLGREAPAYFAAMEQPPLRGLRCNPHKTPENPLSDLADGLGATIPWEENGYYLSLASTAGAHPLHEAGAWYLQEPSAMIPAALLAVQPGETVLDLCAAPGGKSTQLAAAMAGQGTLVCNEIVPRRAQILSRNIERMGIRNALVVSADPAKLAEVWPLLFDAILVDAPCSGEGMFRRHPETRLEWSESSPESCAKRQSHILQSAAAMLKPGGRLCYSTCTLNREENEDVISTFLALHPSFSPVAFSLPIGNGKKLTAQNGGLHIYPHAVQGEGHFVALLLKSKTSSTNEQSPCTLLPPAQALQPPEQQSASAFTTLWQSLAQHPVPQANAMLGTMLLQAPPLPPLRGIRVLRAGMNLGQLKGKVFQPDHALALAVSADVLPRVALTRTQAEAYQRGEALPAPNEVRGYVLVTLHGLALGFAKASDGWLKNHYPKGLRRSVSSPAHFKGETDGNDYD